MDCNIFLSRLFLFLQSEVLKAYCSVLENKLSSQEFEEKCGLLGFTPFYLLMTGNRGQRL